MIYAVGDIHGMYLPLKMLLEKIPLTKDDKIIFLGDYVDRGPQSKQVIDLLKELKNTYSVILLKGNHEDMLLKCVIDGNCYPWQRNGSEATIKSFGSIDNIRVEIPFFRTLNLYHQEGNFFFVHGGVKPKVPINEQDEFEMLWIRDEFIYSKDPLPGKIVVFGHTPFKDVLIMKDKIGIDTGCVYGGKLSAVRLDDLEIFSVNCKGE